MRTAAANGGVFMQFSPRPNMRSSSSSRTQRQSLSVIKLFNSLCRQAPSAVYGGRFNLYAQFCMSSNTLHDSLNEDTNEDVAPSGMTICSHTSPDQGSLGSATSINAARLVIQDFLLLKACSQSGPTRLASKKNHKRKKSSKTH